ncbi:cystathionine beta-lyase [Renibacterium salmoninarum ATCC 33209]|uniref:cysteine-S-conjugate beta-lyase n=1 Tax=Renibacterium salmoninarum (strain ATCC 33209 / DSM 20767 / JCM 11484 / NBRC 15589 / NCIMB 2235) TaxID=288705 RepID=A9WTQ1_RENSM|nr:aminotransferase class I/II-fold pyridoxal phosphate-dependent enzyme [Renibacterium salmoninarum]ABY24572.1 cystathionine beta-lyase [Renibacterium salmoninarum ATCC 33209]
MAEALAEFSRVRYGWKFEPEAMRILPEVLTGVEAAIDAFNPSGSSVILPVPAYMPFFGLIESMGRQRIEVPFVNDGGRWMLDLAAVEEALKAGAGTLLLTNPHNPLGKMFGHAELSAISELVARYSARVVADEIHAPLIYDGVHVPYASVDEAASGHTATLVSTSKAWNLPGLCAAQVILASAKDRAVWDSWTQEDTHGISPLGARAATAAYRDGGPWLDALLTQLRANREFLFQSLSAIPGLKTIAPEATYLAWLDFSAVDLGEHYRLGEGPASYFLREAKVAFVPGNSCGEASADCLRLNFGTTQPILAQAVEAVLAASPR